MAQNESFRWFDRLGKGDIKRKIAVTGAVHAGKTTRLKAMFYELASVGIEAAGFVEEAVFEGERRVGYDFVDVVTGEHCVVARKRVEGEKYSFCEDAWGWAGARLRASEGKSVLIIDELGRLEGHGEGLMPGLKLSIMSAPRHVIASVRCDVLERIESQIGFFDEVIVV